MSTCSLPTLKSFSPFSHLGSLSTQHPPLVSRRGQFRCLPLSPKHHEAQVRQGWWCRRLRICRLDWPGQTGLLLQHDEMKVSTWSVPTSRTTAANTQTQVSESKIMNGESFDYYTCSLWSSALIGTACTIRWKTFQKKSSKDQRMSGNCKLLTGG